MDNALRGATRIGKVPGNHAGFLAKINQIFGIGGCECFIDRLVGISNPYPVAILTDKCAKNFFLEVAGILGFVFQYVIPTMAEPCEIIVIQGKHLESQADQVVKIHRSPKIQGALVIDINLHAKIQ